MRSSIIMILGFTCGFIGSQIGKHYHSRGMGFFIALVVGLMIYIAIEKFLPER